MKYKYRNPVLSGFYPDPSVCRVNDSFYLVNSTFAYFPGLPVFKSDDLLNWKQIGNAIDRPGQLCYDDHEISQGLFAPSIRYNNGVFYIVCTLIKNGGNFIITAKDPAGPWSDPVWLKGADGIDPSIFFDDDGKTWYCGTHPAPEGEKYNGNYEIFIREMDMEKLAKGDNPLKGDQTGIWRGAMKDVIWPEGPHIYKIGNWYYLLHAEGGTGIDHAVCIARAKEISGPWEGKKSNPVVTHRHMGKRSKIINVGHGDLVSDTEGGWWIILLASRQFDGVCPLGRETFIIPVFWENEWPFIATESGLIEDGLSPIDPTEEYDDKNSDSLNSCESFNEVLKAKYHGTLPFHWMVLRMPVDVKNAAFSLGARSDSLRLFTRKDTIREKGHPSFAGRRIRHKDWGFTVSMEFFPKSECESAGVLILQNDKFHYRFERCLSSDRRGFLRVVKAAGETDEIIAKHEFQETEAHLSLTVICEDMELSFFLIKPDGTMEKIADSQDARILSTEFAGGFVGSLAGVYASGNGNDTDNYADIFWADYRGI